MTDITNIKDQQTDPGLSGNISPDTQEIKINAEPSDDITQLIGSLGKPDTEKTLKIPAEQPKRRGRPKGSGRKVAAKAVKKGRPAKRTIKKELPIEIEDDLQEVSEIDESPRRRYLPTSITNLLLFAAVFAILAAAQVGINVEKDNKTPLVVSPIEFTQEEEPQVVEAPVAAEETMEAGSATVTEVQNVEPAPEVKAEVEAPKAEEVVNAEVEAPKAEEVSKVEVKEAPKVAAEECVKVKPKSKLKAKSVSKTALKQKRMEKPVRGGYYTKDAYTSGGPLDIDGPAAREKYLAGNKIKVQKMIESSKTEEQKASRSILDYDEPK